MKILHEDISQQVLKGRHKPAKGVSPWYIRYYYY